MTDAFVYLHVPKTGGTFVETALGHSLRPQTQLYIDSSEPEHRGCFGVSDQHERYQDVPLRYRDRPILVTVRLPHDWHVSLYEFGWWRTHERDTFDPDAIRAAFPHFPRLTFAEYLDAVHDWDLAEPSYAPTVGYAALREHEVGAFTFDLIRYLAPDPEVVFADLQTHLSDWSWLPPVRFLPTHRLGDALHDALVDLGYDSGGVRELGVVRPVGSTRTDEMSWPSYFDAARLARVQHQERHLLRLVPELQDALQSVSPSR